MSRDPSHDSPHQLGGFVLKPKPWASSTTHATTNNKKNLGNGKWLQHIPSMCIGCVFLLCVKFHVLCAAKDSQNQRALHLFHHSDPCNFKFAKVVLFSSSADLALNLLLLVIEKRANLGGLCDRLRLAAALSLSICRLRVLVAWCFCLC